MKHKVLLLSALLSVSAFAQQPPPSEAEISGRIQTLETLLREANGRVVIASGQATDLAAKNQALEKELKALKEPPKDDKKK